MKSILKSILLLTIVSNVIGELTLDDRIVVAGGGGKNTIVWK